MTKTITRHDLAAAVRGYFNSHDDARDMVDQVVREISREITLGHMVKISRFASFGSRLKKRRIGRNPKKPKDEVVIEPRRVVVFTASNSLRWRVANPHFVRKEQFR